MNLDVERAMDFLYFACERHRVWEKRQAGEPQPWTDDPILASKKFTCVQRALDPGSQFVITELMHDDPGVFLRRCFLYRHTGRVDAWSAFAEDVGGYPALRNHFQQMGEFWQENDQKVFTNAYLVYPQSSTPGTNKTDAIVNLFLRLDSEGVFERFLRCDTQQGRFETLRRNKGVGDFMAYQILTDFGYSTEFRENDFTVLGPGAKKGAQALLNGEKAPLDAVHRWCVDALHAMPDCPEIWGMKPSDQSVQNLLCEFSKRVRYQGKPEDLRPYVPAHPGPQVPPVKPALW